MIVSPDQYPRIEQVYDVSTANYASAIWASTTQNAAVLTGSHITSTNDGYVNELLAIGQADTSPGLPTPAVSPYSTQLRPVSDLSVLYRARQCVLRKIEFKAYDTTLSGAAGQDAATLTAIFNSISSQNDVYVQSLFRNGEMGGWQPNWFRPSFSVNGKDIFAGLSQSQFDNKANLGDLSIGLPLPYCREDYVNCGKVEELKVYAQAAQYVAGKYQRYLVLCLAEFFTF